MKTPKTIKGWLGLIERSCQKEFPFYRELMNFFDSLDEKAQESFRGCVINSNGDKIICTGDPYLEELSRNYSLFWMTYKEYKEALLEI